MRPKDFDRLVTSIKQAGAIRRGRLKPGRMTDGLSRIRLASALQLVQEHEDEIRNAWKEHFSG